MSLDPWTGQNIGPGLMRFGGLEPQKDGSQKKETGAQVTSTEVLANYLQGE